ncbi:MAG: hypothetical protein CMB80_03575 [Flammeovirgaceae bacterium]|jgi:hypothetical protein|nr:hypothetical protein [Flammeovirgaceae bacterium]|tara:strand:+ start:1589 stop:1828 length:240 start_codon:yes stop_codon:yes gene_type:complete
MKNITETWRRLVYKHAGLTHKEVDTMPRFIAGVDEFYASTAFEKLYKYFAFETQEMPYGIAKARTGDPDVWILQRLDRV